MFIVLYLQGRITETYMKTYKKLMYGGGSVLVNLLEEYVDYDIECSNDGVTTVVGGVVLRKVLTPGDSGPFAVQFTADGGEIHFNCFETSSKTGVMPAKKFSIESNSLVFDLLREVDARCRKEYIKRQQELVR